MADTKCPVCGSMRFYVKDPQDEFETIEFEIADGCPVFDPELKSDEKPAVDQETRTYCSRCAWHGSFEDL